MGDCSYIESTYCERDNLGDTLKHKHCEVIKAWADGAKIQFRHCKTDEWIDCDLGPAWDIATQYRVKPETARYREALMLVNDKYSVTVTNDEVYGSYLTNHANFVRWLTDWQEVEV